MVFEMTKRVKYIILARFCCSDYLWNNKLINVYKGLKIIQYTI